MYNKPIISLDQVIEKGYRSYDENLYQLYTIDLSNSSKDEIIGALDLELTIKTQNIPDKVILSLDEGEFKLMEVKIMTHQQLSCDTLDVLSPRFTSILWYYVSSYQNLSLDFINKYKFNIWFDRLYHGKTDKLVKDKIFTEVEVVNPLSKDGYSTEVYYNVDGYHHHVGSFYTPKGDKL